MPNNKKPNNQKPTSNTPDSNSHDDREVFRTALRQWDVEQSAAVPAFDVVLHRIAQEASPMDAPRWSALKSLRLTGALAWAQVRIVPWLIIPVVLVTATMAILAARFLGVVHGRGAADMGFSSIMLAGIAVIVTMALSSLKPDSIALTTPLGPQVVVLARITLVLVISTVVGIVASGLAAAWGHTSDVSDLVVSWLSPVALVAGVATFVSIWIAPVAGIVAGIMLIPLAAPIAQALFFFGQSGLLGHILSPLGVLAAGVAVLAAAVASSRWAVVHRLQVA